MESKTEKLIKKMDAAKNSLLIIRWMLIKNRLLIKKRMLEK